MTIASSAARRFVGARGQLLAFALSAGALMSFSQAPWPPWIALPALFLALTTAFFLFIRVESARRAALIGGVFGYGYFFCGLWWVGAAFDFGPEGLRWMKPFAQALLPAYLALFWALAFGGASWAARRFGWDRTERLVALVALWSIVEYGRGWLFSGFPWGLVGYAWLDTPAAQAAAWIGSYGLSALTLALAAMLSVAFAAEREGRRREALRLCGAWLIAVLALNVAGWARIPSEPITAEGPLIRIVQPNVAQSEKGVGALAVAQIELLRELTETPASGPISLVLWPEAAAPQVWPIDYYGSLRREYARSAPGDATLVLGSLRHEFDVGVSPLELGQGVLAPPMRVQRILTGAPPFAVEWWNSAFIVDGDGALAGVYDKRHLVPFGEMVPFERVLAQVGILPVASAFNEGQDLGVARLPNGRNVLLLICYEAMFPRLVATPLEQRPEMILHLTNDAWFGDSAGPWQQLAAARFRAIEQGVPVYRAANTGVSAAIDSYGRLEATLGVGERGVLDVPFSKIAPRPLYAFVSETLWIALLSMVCIIFTSRKRYPQLLGTLSG